MIMKKLIAAILVIFSIASCFQNRKSNSYESQNRLVQFKTFINRFTVLSIPFAANTSCYTPDSLICVPLDMNNDSTFIDYVGSAVTIGLMPDTADFYAVIYCTAAACYMPTLAVFSKEGKRLSKEQISNGCGFAAGYRCADSLIINSILDIKNKLIEESFNYDKNGNEIPNSLTRNITIDHFSIDQSGRINKKKQNGY
jgi:hypothetical protein